MIVDGLSSAQRHVVETLKRQGEASADELAEHLGVTASAVRQHLSCLRASGFVTTRQERGRPGRPVDLYHCTDAGDALFARSTDEFSIELLADIEAEDPAMVEKVFDRRQHRRAARVLDELGGLDLADKVAGLAKILDDEGYLVETEPTEAGTYRVALHSCAIWSVATRFGQACSTELAFLQEVFPEAIVERTAHRVDGAFACGYEIRPLTGQGEPQGH